MNVIVFGQQVDKIVPLLEAKGFTVVQENPDFLVSHGGDGTIVLSEFLYPGVPKIVLKESRICKMCKYASRELPDDEVLDRVRDGKYTIASVEKLSAVANGREFVALNDIAIHNADPRHGMRYRLCVDGENREGEIIGDGVVFSTPFGSSGYYRSITDSTFEEGIGVAFNNSTEQVDHLVLRSDRTIKITVTRGPAAIYADNQDEFLALEEGDVITIKRANSVAKIVRV